MSVPSLASGGWQELEVQGKTFVFASEQTSKLLGMVDRVAQSPAIVLITGETGSGKELFSRLLHERSRRRGRPWVDINCAALPENLVESELFGYEKGAFSGADAAKPGLFEAADTGTLLLDEIGELEPKVQVKLLRVLDGAPFYRLGGHRKITVNVRVIAATNRDLEEAVKVGRFRIDLYHRLAQFHLRVAPLRERPDDVEALARYFLGQYEGGFTLTLAAIHALRSYSWPGNIRELRNVIGRMIVSAPHPEIDTADVLPYLGAESKPAQPLKAVTDLDEMERQMIVKALENTGGDRSLAALQLGISLRTLVRRLQQYNIQTRKSRSKSLGWLSGEQQKYFRAAVSVPVQISAEDREITGTSVNVSSGGIGVRDLSHPINSDAVLRLSFSLPGRNQAICAKGRLAWADSAWRIGVKFVAFDLESEKQLREYLLQRQEEEGWSVPDIS